jgi:hypothetical protein
VQHLKVDHTLSTCLYKDLSCAKCLIAHELPHINTNHNNICVKVRKLCIRMMSPPFDNVTTVVIHISFHPANRGKQTPVHALINFN